MSARDSIPDTDRPPRGRACPIFLVQSSWGVDRVVTLFEQQPNVEADILRAGSYTEADLDKLRRALLTFVHLEFILDRTFDKLQNSPEPTLLGFPELEAE